VCKDRDVAKIWDMGFPSLSGGGVDLKNHLLTLFGHRAKFGRSKSNAYSVKITV